MEEIHLFSGMRRDNHPIRQEPQYLWDAHNIRLTNRDDSTLLSITNERGPKYTGLAIEGKYVGHCIVGNYLVAFTSIDGNYYIYRIEKEESVFKSTTIFEWHDDEGLKWENGWSPDYPIEAIGVYETELIQKVYWVDGKNQPRVINIVEDKLKGKFDFNTTSFDFVATLKLEENISIERDSGVGLFSAGVIQYAFTYYKKYGHESNIFYTSPLHYISFRERGGSPEDIIANSFKITIENIDTSFDYIRIYSIHRTSLDSVPTVKRVTDLQIGESKELSYVDSGTVGDIVDPSLLLYVGGECIVPKTLCTKDNTLFLGNYSISRTFIPNDIKEFFKDEKNILIRTSIRQVVNDNLDDGDYYTYSNQLDKPNISYFRADEHYRLGIQFQHESGKWSDPIVIKKDYTVPIENNGVLYRPSSDKDTLQLPYFYYQQNYRGEFALIVKTLKALGYRKVRGVVCFPNNIDRKVIAQGILCPTVFNYYQRYNRGVYSQASWFLRPTFYGPIEDFDLTDTSTHKDGTIAEFRHCHTLGRSDTEYAEIQSNDISNDGDINNINDIIKLGPGKLQDEFLVDQSILTFHSPNVEFDSNFANLDLQGLGLRLIGIVPFTRNIGDIDIKTSSTVFFSGEGTGFEHTQRGTTTDGGKSQLMGPYYRDVIVTKTSDTDLTPVKSDLTDYAIYPWHRTGSLNSDYSRPVDTGVRTAVLQTKKLSNLKFSDSPVWMNKYYTFKGGITIPELWKDLDGELIKIKGNSYLGNVETILTRRDKYSIVTIGDRFGTDTYKRQSAIAKVSDPISMKYKSTPHLVFKLDSKTSSTEVTLPVLSGKFPAIKTNVESYKETSKNTKESKTVTIYLLNRDGKNFRYDDSLITGSPIGIVGTPGFSTDNNEGVLGGYFYQVSNVVTDNLVEAYLVGLPIGTVCKLITADNTKYYKVIYRYKGTAFFHTMKDVTDEYINIPDEEDTEEEDTEVKIETEELKLEEYFSQEISDNFSGSYLFLAELYRTNIVENSFGGDSEEDIKNNTIWYPACEPQYITELDEDYWRVPFIYGDTYFQRYDCLKTYPYTPEDENQIVEIGSFMCETKINIDGRYDRNRGLTSNIHITPQIFNKLNDIYSQKDNFFVYRIFNEDYYKNNVFSNQVIWSTEKFSGSEIDPWTQVNLATPLNMDGSKGVISKLLEFNDILLCFQEKALCTLQFNCRVQIPTSDGVPIEINNGRKMDGYKFINSSVGCQNKWSVCPTSKGVYFIDDYTDILWMYSGELINMSEALYMKWWFKNNHSSVEWNPQSLEKNGIRTFFDPTYGDVYFTPGPEHGYRVDTTRDALCFSEQLGQFVSQYSYGGTQAMLQFNEQFMSLRQENTQVKLWENFKGEHNKFFNDVPIRWDISFISNKEAATKIFDTLEIKADSFNPELLGDKYSINVQEGQPFDFIRVQNEYQDTDEVACTASNLRKKFRVWRALLPRANRRQRVRNPWAQITIGSNHPGTKETVIHTISVKYTI